MGYLKRRSIINAAKSGDVDCIMANLNVTSERKEYPNMLRLTVNQSS
ncbi:MAG: transporter substrate-binding domain-containing protein [Oribacterium sp.]|nr:transporter substrate-binding domain-containing protein [Oribacterium sp.]